MASFLDAMAFLRTTGIFETILPGLLVIVLAYAILARYKIFGENQTVINAVVAFVLGFIMMSFSQALQFVTYLVPFFVAIFVSLLLLLMVIRFMGVSESDITEAIKKPHFFVIILAVIVLALVASFNFAFPEYTAFAIGGTIDAPIENATLAQQIQLESARILFDPTVMAMIVMFCVFIAAAFVISMPSKS